MTLNVHCTCTECSQYKNKMQLEFKNAKFGDAKSRWKETADTVFFIACCIGAMIMLAYIMQAGQPTP